MADPRGGVAVGPVRIRHWILALLPSLLFVGGLFGRHFYLEGLRTQANADPLASLASPVPSRRFDIAYWWGEARLVSPTWAAASMACVSGRPERINCRRVSIARSLLELERAAGGDHGSSGAGPELDPAPAAPPQKPPSGGARS